MKDNIKPEHYRTGEIDLYEAFSQIFPHNEYRAGMQMIAMRYMFRDKVDRVEDLGKAIYTLERLKEKEIEHAEKYEEIPTKNGTIHAKGESKKVYDDGVSILWADNEPYNEDLGSLRALQECGYKYLTRNRNGGLRAHIYLPLRIGNHWVSLGYFDRGYNIDLTQVEWEENKLIEISDLLATYENGGENGK